MSYTEPLLLIFLLVCLAGLMQIRSCKNKIVLIIGLVGIFLLSWPPAAWLFSRSLEYPYSLRPFRTPPQPEAIVVLGGGISPPRYERPYALPDPDTFQHCAMAAWVYKHTGPLPVLGCEGSHGQFPSVLRELLKGGGVADELIWIENRSHNTHENAVYGAAILRQHGIHRVALVTDAQSMRRAAACFAKQGIIVLPAPSEFRHLNFTSDNLLPNWKAIRRNERTLHEAFGLAWYALKGWT